MYDMVFTPQLRVRHGPRTHGRRAATQVPRIDRFPNRTLELRVSRTGTDYRVEIERRAAYCEPPTIPYLLTLKLKP